ncbi:MAG: hypothetical protein GX443_11510 [Deltaproteobacteria bacterium]|nr:hypothetical protein [Deltaproteobacteria bacterium]
MNEWVLAGLNGTNPLAFLAAIGTLRVSTLAFPDRTPRMRWAIWEGAWRPWLSIEATVDVETWLEGIDRVLREETGHIAFGIADNLNLPIEAFRKVGRDAMELARPNDRRYADFLAAFGSDAVESVVNGKRSGMMADTALRTMSGAGHQHFLGFMRTLAKDNEIKDIRSALLGRWTYSDPGPSMRWDPNDDRRYALRWLEPSGDPIRTVRGANRLAIEGIPLLPTMPVKGRLETTGFTQEKRRQAVWSWPIWKQQIGLKVLSSLISLPELQKDNPDRNALMAMGIAEVYRCDRITEGKYRNFTIAHPV